MQMYNVNNKERKSKRKNKKKEKKETKKKITFCSKPEIVSKIYWQWNFNFFS